MMHWTWMLSALLAVICAAGVHAGVDVAQWGFYLFKPLTTLLLIHTAWRHFASSTTPPALRRWVLAGGVASLLGDVALLWPQEGFIWGLCAFLVAHTIWVWGFVSDRRASGAAAPKWFGWISYGVYGSAALAVLSVLWPSIEAPLRGPVLAYVCVLSAMAAETARWAVATAASRPALGRPGLSALGGALFVLSDAWLAADKFTGPLPWASSGVLTLYWTAVACIIAGTITHMPLNKP